MLRNILRWKRKVFIADAKKNSQDCNSCVCALSTEIYDCNTSHCFIVADALHVLFSLFLTFFSPPTTKSDYYRCVYTIYLKTTMFRFSLGERNEKKNVIEIDKAEMKSFRKIRSILWKQMEKERRKQKKKSLKKRENNSFWHSQHLLCFIIQISFAFIILIIIAIQLCSR